MNQLKPPNVTTEKTANLRIIERGTTHVLQQQVIWYTFDRSTGGFDWVDVPVIRENGKAAHARAALRFSGSA